MPSSSVMSRLRTIAERYGIKYATLWHRVKKQGLTIRKAVRTNRAWPLPRYRYRGKRLFLREVLKYAVVSKDTFLRRIQNGWRIAKAVETPLYQRRKRMVAMKLTRWEAYAGRTGSDLKDFRSKYAASPEPLGPNTVHARRYKGLGRVVIGRDTIPLSEVRESTGIPLRKGVKIRRRDD